MSKKVVGLAIWAVLLALSFPAGAQQAKKIPRIGFLASVSASSDSDRIEAFRLGLRELGYVEGQNVTIEYRWADGKFEQLPDLAAELVRLKVDVIVAVVTQASLAAKKATGTIPIVMVGVSDPVGSGLVASLARPGTNITGTSSMTRRDNRQTARTAQGNPSQDLPSGRLVESCQSSIPGPSATRDGGRSPGIGRAASDPGGARSRRDRPRLRGDGERAHEGTPNPR